MTHLSSGKNFLLLPNFSKWYPPLNSFSLFRAIYHSYYDSVLYFLLQNKIKHSLESSVLKFLGIIGLMNYPK